jgi:hypothetical protein
VVVRAASWVKLHLIALFWQQLCCAYYINQQYSINLMAPMHP